MARSDKRIFVAGAVLVERTGQLSGAFQKGAAVPGPVTCAVGGPAYRAALALRQYGADVALFSARGGDADGAMMAGALLAAGIDDLALTWLDRASPSALTILDDAGDRVTAVADLRLTGLLSGRACSRRHLREAMAPCHALILDGHLPSSAIAYLLRAFAGRPMIALGASAAGVTRLLPQLPSLSLLVLTRGEAAALVDAPAKTGLGQLMEMLSAAGVRRAVVTNGRQEAGLLDGDRMTRHTLPEALGPSDAQDREMLLAAGTALGLAEARTLAEAFRLGLAAATRLAVETTAEELSP